MTKLPKVEPDHHRLLCKAAVIAAASPIWIKPVVNTMVLPGHAQTTGTAVATTTTLNPSVEVVLEVIIPDLLASKQPRKP